MLYHSISRCSTKVLKPRRRKSMEKNLRDGCKKKEEARSTMKLVKWESIGGGWGDLVYIWMRMRMRMRMYLYVWYVRMCCTCSPSMLLGNVDFNEMDSRAEPYIKVFMLKMCRIRFAWFHCCNYSAMLSCLVSVCVCMWNGTYIQNLTTKTS